jgi:isoleucyl-tRNA synthetase
MFEKVDPKVNFVDIEKKWLLWWKSNNILAKYLERNKDSDKKFFFLDGPITANNPMGVHHAWGRTYKDLWQRFKNMQGFKQTFRNGFDNQGLWVEVEVEKQLGFKSKKDIEEFGIEKFVEKCKEATLHWAGVQTEQSKRLGYFMDWDNSYYTMSDDNNYTIWHFLKTCHKKGLLYKGVDSVPWCPRCGTAISQHEILQEEYQELVHESVIIRLPFGKTREEIFKDEYLLVWTTTPWTIPANALVALNPELKYSLVSFEGKKYWLASSRVKFVFKGEHQVLKEVSGKELLDIGRYYKGPFDDLPVISKARKENPKAFHQLVAAPDLVSEEEGTGLVHIAPGCGAEDFRLAVKELNYPEMVISAIDESANYLEGYGELSGKNAKNEPGLIFEALKKIENGKYLFKTEEYTHRYPVCWRCKTELVWRVVDEWYIKMDPLREPLKKVARQATWKPPWALEREIDWLNHMSDWLISKKRYWGLALPIWECECGNFEVIGSREELREKAVEGVQEFEGHSPHRPWIDEIKIKCSRCGKKASRIKDVGNPWLDAGIVPYSTLVDPETGNVSYLANKEYWQKWFPADFITECFPGQFKNWFYSILAMSTVLENKAPFRTLLGHALVRDEKGEEMHKSKGNAIWFDDAAEKMGVDVMRWMYVTQNPEMNLNFGYGLADETRRRFHLLLWNVYNFFITYARMDGFKGKGEDEKKESKNILDKWILSRVNNLILLVTKSLEDYDAFNASRAIEGFVNDFSTWYIRRSRSRVGIAAEDRGDKDSFYATAHEVLLILSKLLAPFNPFFAEEIFKNLSPKESVHLEDWPSPESAAVNNDLEEKMAFVRQVVELGHSKRKTENLKVRQPLSGLVVKNSSYELDGQLSGLIKDELNVKKVEFIKGKGEISVKLDTKITPELKEEGEAREIIRKIQEARKEMGCGLEDRVRVGLPAWPKKYEEEIKRKTLADNLYKAETLTIEKCSE